MKTIKLLMLILLSFTLTNCKVQFDEDGDIVKITDDDDQTSNHYVGEVDSIRYFYGGWHGPYPNFKTDLTLNVTARGKISFDLETPECKAAGRIGIKTYSRLANMILEADTVEVEQGPADIGDRLLELVVEGDEQVFHMGPAEVLKNKNDLQLAKKDSNKINKFLQRVIRQLEDKNCGLVGIDTRILSLTYKETQLNYYRHYNRDINTKADQLDETTTPDQPLSPPRQSIDRKFTITNENGTLKVNGSELIHEMNRHCSRVVRNKVLDIDIIEDMEKIKFTESQVICMLDPIGMRQVHFSVERLEAGTQEGSEGCWNQKRVSNTQDFKKKFLKWLDQQPQRCAEGIYTNQ